MALNTNTLQIPVPRYVQNSLQSTEELINELANSHLDINKISNLTIGYQLEETSVNQIVNFIPSWFINYNGKWISLSKLVGGEQ